MKGMLPLSILVLCTSIAHAILIPDTHLVLSGNAFDNKKIDQPIEEDFSPEERLIVKAALDLSYLKSNSSDKLPSRIIVHEDHFECGTENSPKSYVDYIKNGYEPDVEDETVPSGVGDLTIPESSKSKKGVKQKIKDKFSIKSIEEEGTTIYILNGTAIDLALSPE